MRRVTLLLALVVIIILGYLASIVKEKFDHVDETSEKKHLRTIPPNDVWTIQKGQVGHIKVGMSMIEANKALTHFLSTKVPAHNFGYDGGGNTYLYSKVNQPFLALIPHRDSSIVLAIVAISPEIKTFHGLSPQTSVVSLNTVYTNMMMHLDEMNGWEFFEDKKNNWQFVFKTQENQRIAKYPVFGEPAPPLNLLEKSNWVVIK